MIVYSAAVHGVVPDGGCCHDAGEHGRFFKTSLCMHDHGVPVTAKTYVRRSETEHDVSKYEDVLLSVESRLSMHGHSSSTAPSTGFEGGGSLKPDGCTGNMTMEKKSCLPICLGGHVWSNQQILRTDQAVHIVRQYFWSSLAQRMTSRPFLTWSEKSWIAYQTILSVMEAHACGVCHGDVKTENLMLTSWGWVFLVDFLPFKPVWLPRDNPSDFSIFFDTSGKRKCCVAPERFVSWRKSDNLGNDLQPAMDIFSLGCVLAELFSDGKSTFEYADVLEYSRSGTLPSTFLENIDSRVVSPIKKMLEREPARRPNATECAVIFAECDGVNADDFNTLDEMFHDWYRISLEERVDQAISSFPASMEMGRSEEGCCGLLADGRGQPNDMECDQSTVRDKFIDISEIDHVGKNLMEEISSILKDGPESVWNWEDGIQRVKKMTHGSPDAGQIELQGRTALSDPSSHSILYHNLAVVYCTLLRSCRHFPSKLALLFQIQHCAGLCKHRDILLHVVIPHVVTAATDMSGRSRTKAYAVSLLAKVLSLLDEAVDADGLPTSVSHIAGDYILPSISLLPHDSEVLVQSAYASSIGSISKVAIRSTYYESSTGLANRDAYLKRIRGTVERGVHDILVGASPLPKVSLLPNLIDVSYSLGCQGSIDDLLPALLTLFNAKEWNVRASLYAALECIFPILGPKALPFILPFTERLLTDPAIEPLVAGIKFLTVLIRSGLLSSRDVLQINQKISDLGPAVLNQSIIRGHLMELRDDSRKILGSVESIALLEPIYRDQAWRKALSPQNTFDHTNLNSWTKHHLDNLHVEQSTPFHAEFLSNALDTYTFASDAYDHIDIDARSNASSKLEQIIKNTQGKESRKRGPVAFQQHSAQNLTISQPKVNQTEQIAKYQPLDWMPEGIMVARIPCHLKPITQISKALCKGSTMFATSSKDGTCKVWDTRKIEKDIHFSPVKTFIGTSGYNSVCAASSISSHLTVLAGRVDGVLEEWDVRHDQEVSTSWTCSPGGILDLQYMETRNLCLVSTGAHGVLGVDQRIKNPCWRLHVDACQGVPGRIATDSNCPHYFVSGTTRGYMSVWDLRFMIPVKTWQNPAKAPIESLTLISGEQIGVMSPGPVAITACGTDEVSVWDVVSGTCMMIMISRASPPDPAFVPEALKVSVMNNRMPVEDPIGLARQMGASDLRSLSSKRTSVKSVLVTPAGKILSGGVDKCIRLWNPRIPTKSYLVAGPQTKDQNCVSHSFSVTHVRDTNIIADYQSICRLDRPPGYDCGSIWHSGAISCMRQLQGQGAPLLASGTIDGVLHVWR